MPRLVFHAAQKSTPFLIVVAGPILPPHTPPPFATQHPEYTMALIR